MNTDAQKRTIAFADELSAAQSVKSVVECLRIGPAEPRGRLSILEGREEERQAAKPCKNGSIQAERRRKCLSDGGCVCHQDFQLLEQDPRPSLNATLGQQLALDWQFQRQRVSRQIGEHAERQMF